MNRYNPKDIEPYWQKKWQESSAFKSNDHSHKPKYYALSFFPYPSGKGLHIGHTRNFTITDVMARFHKMNGYEVLHPMGWDSFGLPGENYAIKTGINPKITTKENTDNFRLQCKKLGLSIDWEREFSSSDPSYYKWTQWFFLLLYERGLAYQKESAQFWCDKCKTVLANEQVVNGCCWRHEDTQVTKKVLKQWFFKITEFAERLEKDLEKLDWPEGIKLMQRNWIGRSQGAEIDFRIADHTEILNIFTTRPDTLYGTTFMVLAPEHPFVTKITTNDQKENVESYVAKVASETDLLRMDESREKTGVFTGAYAINPANGQKIPIWIADYVLLNYGSGAIMAVPAHDERDFNFAKKMKLPIKYVFSKVNVLPDSYYNGEGIIKNSDIYNGLSTSEAREKIIADLFVLGLAREKINYKIRDWLISRQRYWGAPIPMIHCQKCGTVPVSKQKLPVELPEIEDFAPSGDGNSPLSKDREWVEIECPECGGMAERETDTMDGFACSSWYFLRFADPKNSKEAFSRELSDKWLPVDMYIGGAEHAVMHLLYARMWTKVMFDAGLINFDEPFKALRNQGMLLAPDGLKISKSKGNDIKPDEIIDNGYGADSLRMITLFLAPYTQSTPWSNEGLAGCYRFLQRLWTLVSEFKESNEHSDDTNETIIQLTHKTVKKVTEDLRSMGFNTAISIQMELVNELYKIKAKDGYKDTKSWHHVFSTLAQLLAPIAPHISEELWHQLDGNGSVHASEWPAWDDKFLLQDKTTIVIQINGKVRANISIGLDFDEHKVTELARQNEKVVQYLKDKNIQKTVFVNNKLLSIVTD